MYGKRPILAAFALLALSFAGAALMAQSPEGGSLQELQQRIKALEEKLAQQEAKNQALEQQILELRELVAPRAAAAGPQKPAAPAPQPEAPKPPAPDSFALTSASKVQLYGYLKLDAAYETSATYPGDYMLWVKPYPPATGRQPEWHETANQSRFGLNFKAADTGDIAVRGRAEIDFYGGGAENKANPMMRHAYMEFEWPKLGFTLLAGQTSDVISPLTPPTLYYSVGWYQGNIGYRHPQIRLTQVIPTGEKSGWNLQFALVRPMGHELADQRTGPDSAHPDLQGRVAYKFPAGGGQAGTVGLSGHWGQETYRTTVLPIRPVEVQSSSWNLDVAVPLSRRVTLTGEAFTGRDLDAFLGGSSEAVDYAEGAGTASSGGWLALSVKASPAWTFNVGLGTDDPRNSDLHAGARSRNRIAFSNVWFSFAKSALVGFEASYMDTQYLGLDTVHAVRGQLAFQYNF